jgi:hypothetical protein
MCSPDIPIDGSSANAANDGYSYDQKYAMAMASHQLKAEYLKKRTSDAQAKAKSGKHFAPGKGKFFVEDSDDDE